MFIISSIALGHFWDSSPKRICLSHFVSKDMTPNWMSHFKAWLDFVEEPISQCSHDRTDCLCGLSFVKVIQIRQTLHKLCVCFLVLVKLKQSGVSSLVFSSFVNSNTLFLVYFQGVTKFKVSWTSLRWNAGVSVPLVPWSAPFIQACWVQAAPAMCNFRGWCFLVYVLSTRPSPCLINTQVCLSDYCRFSSLLSTVVCVAFVAISFPSSFNHLLFGCNCHSWSECERFAGFSVSWALTQ